LLPLAGALAGCNGDDEYTLIEKNAALIATCASNLPVYQWQDKLYYREKETMRLRQVIAKPEDVCSKFRTVETVSRSDVVQR
jgi:hypothetical protein